MPTPLDPELIDQIRASLYEGRGVRLFGDDAPTTMLEPSTEMTAEGDAFLTGKLDKIAELLDRGFVVNIDSQGAILATTPDRRSRYISTQETDIDVMDRLMIKQALEQGSKVSFEPDGSLVIDAVADAAVPTAEVAAARFAEFERLADSGQINSELADGRDFQFDETVVPMAPPDSSSALEDPFDTAAELEAEAAALQVGLEAARDLSLEEYATDKGAAEAERLAVERTVTSITAEKGEAERQIASARADLEQYAAKQAALLTEVARANDVGDVGAAVHASGEYESYSAIMTVREQSIESAQTALAEVEARLAGATSQAVAATQRSTAIGEEQQAMQSVLEGQEAEARLARSAAAELSEAERLEAALPDLEARGVEGTERIRDAIAEHRATAEALVQQARLRETTGIVVEGQGDPEQGDPEQGDPDQSDPDQSDPDQSDPDQSDPGVLPPDHSDPDALHPESDPVGFAMIDDPDTVGQPRPPAPARIDPDPTEADDRTNDEKGPGHVGPDDFTPKPIGPEDFEVELPSEPEAPDGWSPAWDTDGGPGEMSAGTDDFASEISNIDDIEADLDGLAEF